MSDPVEVIVREGECPCPGTPHADERVYLEPELTSAMAQAGLGALNGVWDRSGDELDLDAELVRAWLPRGIRSWSFTEEYEEEIEANGRKEKRTRVQPVKITHENFERLLPFDQGGFEVQTKGGELWMGRFMRPLVARWSKLSVLGSTDDSTPQIPMSGSPPHKPSRRSSHNGTAGKPSEAPVR